MADEKKGLKQKTTQNTFERIEKIHPHKMLLYLGIVGSSLVFFFMLVAFALTRPKNIPLEYFYFPKAFVVSTVILLLSAFSVSKVLSLFVQEEVRSLKNVLAITLGLGIAFTISQVFGWLELYNAKVFFQNEIAGAYLYVISGLHGVHLLGGLIFLTTLLVQMVRVEKDPVKALIVFTNPYQRIRYEMLAKYWHFMDILWIILFFYFLFSF